MTESAGMVNAPLTEVLQKTVGPLKVISATPNTVTVHENGIDSTTSKDMVKLAPYNAQKNDGTDRESVRITQVFAGMKMELMK